MKKTALMQATGVQAVKVDENLSTKLYIMIDEQCQFFPLLLKLETSQATPKPP